MLIEWTTYNWQITDYLNHEKLPIDLSTRTWSWNGNNQITPRFSTSKIYVCKIAFTTKSTPNFTESIFTLNQPKLDFNQTETNLINLEYQHSNLSNDSTL